MRLRKWIPLLLAALILGVLPAGCSSGQPGTGSGAQLPQSTGSAAVVPEETPGTSSPSGSPVGEDADHALKQAAREAVEILRDRDLARLAKIADPNYGLRFSPYAHIDEQNSLLFQADELPSFSDNATYIWGVYDGSGEPIELSFRDYFETFVYNQDYSGAPVISVNTLKGQGNVPFNGAELYPDASYVEFHFPGFDAEHEGMDWESLILIMRPAGAEWKLAAIVHAGWTI